MTGFFREMVKCIAVSILAGLMALLVGGALWAAEGFPLPGKSAEAVAEAGQDSPENTDGENEGKLSVEVPTVTVVQPKVQDNGVGENTPESDVPDTSIDSETESAKPDAQEPKEDVTLLFAGDLFLTDILQEKYDRNGISAAAAPELLDVTRGADIFMLNQEFPFGTTGEAVEDKE